MFTNVRKQEIYCHACDGHVQFELDLDLDGDYELQCPNCGHTHYRRVRQGIITDIRWRSSSQQFMQITTATYSVQSILTTMSSGTGGAYYQYYMATTAT